MICTELSNACFKSEILKFSLSKSQQLFRVTSNNYCLLVTLADISQGSCGLRAFISTEKGGVGTKGRILKSVLKMGE